jgi:hypothetical protein
VWGLVLVLLCACEPKTPSRSAWRTDAYYAVTDVSSDVATAQLVLQQLIRDRVPGNYAQVALVTAESDAGKKAQKLGAYQPPPPDIPRLHYVSSVLSDAQDLLTDVRIAVVRRQSSTYPDLVQRLKKQTTALDDASKALGGLQGV